MLIAEKAGLKGWRDELADNMLHKQEDLMLNIQVKVAQTNTEGPWELSGRPAQLSERLCYKS